jgi:hypothetical protein
MFHAVFHLSDIEASAGVSENLQGLKKFHRIFPSSLQGQIRGPSAAGIEGIRAISFFNRYLDLRNIPFRGIPENVPVPTGRVSPLGHIKHAHHQNHQGGRKSVHQRIRSRIFLSVWQRHDESSTPKTGSCCHPIFPDIQYQKPILPSDEVTNESPLRLDGRWPRNEKGVMPKPSEINSSPDLKWHIDRQHHAGKTVATSGFSFLSILSLTGGEAAITR